MQKEEDARGKREKPSVMTASELFIMFASLRTFGTPWPPAAQRLSNGRTPLEIKSERSFPVHSARSFSPGALPTVGNNTSAHITSCLTCTTSRLLLPTTTAWKALASLVAPFFQYTGFKTASEPVSILVSRSASSRPP